MPPMESRGNRLPRRRMGNLPSSPRAPIGPRPILGNFGGKRVLRPFARDASVASEGWGARLGESRGKCAKMRGNPPAIAENAQEIGRNRVGSAENRPTVPGSIPPGGIRGSRVAGGEKRGRAAKKTRAQGRKKGGARE